MFLCYSFFPIKLNSCEQGTPVSERAVPVAIFETDAGKNIHKISKP